MNVDVGNVKGFEDYLTYDSLRREEVSELIRNKLKLYGFMPVETPLVEYDELLKPNLLPSEVAEEASFDRFKFEDRATRKLSLRYDFLVQFPKLLKKDPLIRLPVRLYQIGKAFKDQPIRPGRTREFTLVNADILGDASQNAEIEILMCLSEIFKELGIDFQVNISSKKLISAVIDSVQIESKRQFIKELDKLERIGEDLVKMNLKKYADSNQILTVFKMLEKTIEFFTENAFEGADEVSDLLKLCNKNKIPVKFNPFIISSQTQYTSNIFEIMVDKSRIAVGGRYDNYVGKLIGIGMPAVGISFSLESIEGTCKAQLEKLELKVDPKVLVISIEKDIDSRRLVKILRENNISCLMTSDKLSSSLEYANYYKIPYVIFLGKDEVEKERFKLRDNKTGEENIMTEKQLISFLKKN